MILLMAGTSEGRELATKLYHTGYNLLVTTASEYGARQLEEEMDQINKPLTEEELVKLGRERGLTLIIDATHPYAQEVSTNSQRACKRLSIPYLRLEREGGELTDSEKVIRVKDYQEAIEVLEPYQRIMLTTGSKNLKSFLPLIKESNKDIFVRVLPRRKSMEICWQLGVDMDKIFACQGPFGSGLNRALIEQYEIQALVSKESGKQGGVDQKIEAAQDCGIPVILIRRPEMSYLKQVSNINQVIDYLENGPGRIE